MTKLRLVLLATTALTAMQFASPSSHAHTAPLVVAQANEVGPDGKPKPKEPPKAAPAHPAPHAPSGEWPEHGRPRDDGPQHCGSPRGEQWRCRPHYEQPENDSDASLSEHCQAQISRTLFYELVR